MSKWLEGLNEQQLKVAKKIDGCFIVNSVAGSGKTATITARTAYMIEKGINPESILMFTFTRKAALEMKSRLVQKIGEQAKKVTICTYHSFSSMLLRRFSYLIGYDRNFTICDKDDANKIIKDLCPNNAKLADISREQISKWKSQGITYEDAANNKTIQNEFITVYKIYVQYQRKLEKNNSMDFDDLTLLGARILNQYSEVQEYVWNKYKYVIADEFQDSSTGNWNYIQDIIKGNNNFCAVMDNNQSIYGFRGADVDFICKEIVRLNYEQYALERNYRSTTTVVDASNAVVNNNPQIIKKNCFSKQEKGNKIYVRQLQNNMREADFVVRSVLTMKKNGLNFKDMCILSRTKKQFNVIEKAFIKNSIPYNLISGTPFCNRIEIKDILCVLRLLLNNRDEEALERIINIPKAGIGEATFNKLMIDCGKEDVIEKMEFNLKLIKGKASKGVKSFIKKFKELKVFAEENVLPSLIINKYIELFDYVNYLRDTYDNGVDRYCHVSEFSRIANEFDTIEELLESTLGFDEEEVETEELNKDGVQMMTIHASKGLEFEAVIIVGGNESLFPHIRSLSRIQDIEEERRLWYVAMTRAKKALMICYYNDLFINGTAKRLQPSRFVNEIPEEFKQTVLLENIKQNVKPITKVNINEVF